MLRNRRLHATMVMMLAGLVLAGAALALSLPDPPPPEKTLATGNPPNPVDPAVDPAVDPETPPLTVADDASDESFSFDPGHAGFSVQIKDEVIPYDVFGVYSMPGDTLVMEAVFTAGRNAARLDVSNGNTKKLGMERWQWIAPDEPGIYPVTIIETTSQDSIRLNMVVKTPYDHSKGSLNGYRIGTYQRKPLRGQRAYIRPEGFIEVTPENRDMRVSPHFTLGQFLCKQTSDFPKYLELKERLPLKLEMMLQEVNENGVDAATLHVMSGFRTPWYNRSIGNRTKYSQHLYGSAADVYVDTDKNANMDDLNGDGRVTRADARVMANIIESQKNEAWYRPFVGGLGVYGPASHRGPFVHVDVRGSFARW